MQFYIILHLNIRLITIVYRNTGKAHRIIGWKFDINVFFILKCKRTSATFLVIMKEKKKNTNF